MLVTKVVAAAPIDSQKRVGLNNLGFSTSTFLPLIFSSGLRICAVRSLLLYNGIYYNLAHQGACIVTIDRPSEQLPAVLSDPLSGSICYELRKTSVAVMAAMSREFGQWNLKPSEANLLKYVAANPGCTQSDIARAHRNNATNLVPLVSRLDRDGLLERESGVGRAFGLSISPKGIAVLANIDAGFERLEDQLGSNLTTVQRGLIVDALRIICKAACHYDKS